MKLRKFVVCNNNNNNNKMKQEEKLNSYVIIDTYSRLGK